jgi:hypothetical protein
MPTTTPAPTTVSNQPATADPAEAGWDRRRLLTVATVCATVVVLLAAGLVYAVVWTVRTATTPAATDTADPVRGPLLVDDATPEQRRDAIAAAPMTAVDVSAATAGAPATTPAPTMVLPSPTAVGAADVPTGYPHTPPGAVAQLAAITTSVVSAMSVQHATAVHRGWAAPGAPVVSEWVMTRNVQAFLAAAGLPTTAGASGALVVAEPVAVQVKGVDGPDWVLGCVLLDVQATLTAHARIGYGHCERLAWDAPGARWVIAPGAQPATAPSTWPGTQAALDAGWVTLALPGQD